MALKLVQLETFYWIARFGTFHAVAHKLNLTQPTLSARIRELELSLGVSLFRREGRLMRVTADGSTLLPHAESMVAIVEQIEKRVSSSDPCMASFALAFRTALR